MMIVVDVLVVLVALIIFLALIAPKEYKINRSIIINRSLPETFQYLKLIKNQDNWSPWKKKDINMTQTFEGTDGEVGFISKWNGNKDVGSGEQEIITIIENESIDSQLRFFKPWKSVAVGHFLVDEVEHDQTMVTWGFSGKNKFPWSIFMLFMNMDKSIGKDFEEGLASLKRILDK